MPRASIIVAASDPAQLEPTLHSLCAQSFIDFEIIVVDDSPANCCAALATSFGDLRIRVLSQKARGRASARNSGIAAARGDLIGFCDAGDLWAPTKLAEHVSHLQARPSVGLSFSAADTMTADGRRVSLWKVSQGRRVGAAEIFRRNPIGGASTAVLRRSALLGLGFRPPQETERDWWFDETFRQCESLELWLRLALTTDWEIAGISKRLCTCKVSDSSDAMTVGKKLAAWERIVIKLSAQDRHFFGRHTSAARAYLLRHLARRALIMRDATRAVQLLQDSLGTSLRPLIEEPRRTLSVLGAAALILLHRTALFDRLSNQRDSSL